MSSNLCDYMDTRVETIKRQTWAACGCFAARSKYRERGLAYGL